MLETRPCRAVDRLLGRGEGDLSHEAVCVCVSWASLLHITWGGSSFGRLGCFDPECVYPGESALPERDDNTTSQTQLMSSNNLPDDAHALTKPMNLVSASLSLLNLLWNRVNYANVAEEMFLCRLAHTFVSVILPCFHRPRQKNVTNICSSELRWGICLICLLSCNVSDIKFANWHHSPFKRGS